MKKIDFDKNLAWTWEMSIISRRNLAKNLSHQFFSPVNIHHSVVFHFLRKRLFQIDMLKLRKINFIIFWFLFLQRPPSSSLSYGGAMNDDVRSPGSGSTPGPLSQQPPHGLDTDPGKSKFDVIQSIQKTREKKCRDADRPSAINQPNRRISTEVAFIYELIRWNQML